MVDDKPKNKEGNLLGHPLFSIASSYIAHTKSYYYTIEHTRKLIELSTN